MHMEREREREAFCDAASESAEGLKRRGRR